MRKILPEIYSRLYKANRLIFFFIFSTFFQLTLSAQNAIPGFTQKQTNNPSLAEKKIINPILDLSFNDQGFIENKGQYGDTLNGYGKLGKILYGYEGLSSPVLFTPKGIIHLQKKIKAPSEEEKERMEHRGMTPEEIAQKTKRTDRTIAMSWIGANPNPQVSVQEIIPGYHTYGQLAAKANCYKKIIYKELYPGIDLIYSVANNKKAGFEYSLIIQPGADTRNVKMQYDGDIKILKKDKKGNLRISSDIDNINVSFPVSYYSNNDLQPADNDKIESSFAINNNTISIQFPSSFDNSKAIVVDPFISGTGNLTGVNNAKAKDIDFDYNGNIYVTGGGDGTTSHKIAKYNAAGVLQWTFSGTLPLPAWDFGPYYGGWVVEKTSGNVYMGQGFNFASGFIVIRINTFGLYDNYITTGNPNFRENWKMYWNCNSGFPQILIAGGGTNSDINLGICSPPSVTLTATNITGIPNIAFQDMSDMVIDPLTNSMYSLYASGSVPVLNNSIYKHTAPYSSASIAWNVPSGFTPLQEAANRPYLGTAFGGLNDNSGNMLAINAAYLFYWDGKNLKAFDKSTGAVVGTPLTVAANTVKMTGGIIADACNNVFVGFPNGTIKVYNFNGATFNDAVAPDINITGFPANSVYDLAYNESQKLLYASGDGFAGSFDIAAYCPTTVYTLSITPDCASASATATVSPTPPAGSTVNYTLYDGSTQISSNNSGVFKGLSPNINYTIIATINLACSGTQTSANFSMPGPTVSAIKTNTSCGVSTGTITASAVNGAAPYTFSTNGTTFITGGNFINLTAGLYTITAKDINGCTNTTVVNIVNSNGPLLTYTKTDATCSNNDGTVTLNASGGTAPLEYSINGTVFQSNNFFTGLTGGQYTMTVKDAAGCINKDAIVISSSQAPSVIAVPASAACSLNNGSISAFGSGGTAPLEYSINGNIFQPGGSFINLTPGAYTVTVRDANGCIKTTNVTVANSPAPVVNATATGATCNNINGSITATGTGGVAPLTYSINGFSFQSNNIFTGLAAGTYTITIKDATGCTNTKSVVVTSIGGPVVSAIFTASACNTNNGSITVNASGVAPFQYSTDGINFQFSNIFTGLASATYIVLAKDGNGCIGTTVVVLPNTTSPNLSVITTPSSCNSNDGIVTATVSGGTAPFQYSINGIIFQASNIFTGLAPLPYTVTVKDVNGCIQTKDVIVANASGLTIAASAINTTCNFNNGVITAAASGGTAPLQYSINGTTYQASNVFNGLAGAVYTIYVKDANGCIITTTATVDVLSAPSVTAFANNSCSNTNGSIEADGNGGDLPLQYSINGTTFQNSRFFFPLTPGAYTVTVKDASGCSNSTVVTILNITGTAPSLTVKFHDAHTCNIEEGTGRVDKIVGSGGTAPYTYSLDGGVFVSLPPNPNNQFLNLVPGLHTVTVMDANGCTNTVSGTVLDIPSATVTATVTPENPCGAGNGTITVTGHGSSSTPYHFSLNSTFGPFSDGDPSFTFTGLSGGVYTITVEDDDGFPDANCANSISVIVPSTGGPSVITSKTNSACGLDNGSITAVGSGGTGTLLYNLNGGAYQSSGEFTGLFAGTYFITVQDDGGCINGTTVILTDPGAPTIEADVTPTSCNLSNGIITATGAGGSPPLKYSVDGIVFQNSNVFTGLKTGSYSVYVKDNNGCYSFIDVAVTANPFPKVTAYTVSASCNNNDGAIIATGIDGTAPYQYSINGIVFQSSNTFTGLPAGFYTVTIKDDRGCISTTGVSVGNNSGPAISAVPASASCGNSNGNINVTASGGAGTLQYSKDGTTFQASNIFNGLLPGAFTITVKDAVGCSNSKIFSVGNINGPGQLTAVVTDATCGINNGKIIAAGTGGTAPLQYSIDGTTFQPGNTFNSLAEAPYTITVKDANGCTATVNKTIRNLSAPGVIATSSPASCGKNDGTITVTAVGGTGVLAYSNNGVSFQSSNIFTGLAAGSYSITVKDINGCTDGVPSVNITSSGNSSGSTTAINICSDQLPFNWNSTAFNSTGKFIVHLTNAAGCDSSATLNLTVKNTSFSTTNQTVCSNQLPYLWNGNNYNLAGAYNVTLTNAVGCDSTATLNLTVKNTSFSITNQTVCSNQLPYTWNGNNYNLAGAYNVTLTNAVGCDSTATLNLTVKNTSFSITNQTVCSNQLPYTWNGNNYNLAGTYNVTLTNAIGCDSVATLNLTIKNTSFSTTNQTVCSNQLPYTWNGNNYNLAGTYNVTLTNAIGCDSVATLNLTVKNTSSSTTNQTVCSNQLPYFWNGNNYNLAGTYNVTLTNTAGCDSVATLKLAVKNTSSSTTNQTVCSNQLPYFWNGNNYNLAGTYNATLTNAAGCDSVATLNLTVKNTSSSTTNQTVCSNQLPYFWNGNNYNLAGTYNATLTNAIGCDSVATLNLTVKNTSSSTTNQTVCSNQLPYFWNGNNYNLAGTYNVTLTNTAGCDSVATLKLAVKNTSSSTTNQTVCSNQLPYFWNGNNYSLPGTYNVTLTNAAGCDSVATLNLIVKATNSSTTTINICSDQLPFIWNGLQTNTAGSFLYSILITNVEGCDSIATLNLTVNNVLTSTTNISICSNQLPYSWNGNSYNVSGTYNINLTSTSGCDSIATLNLTIKNTSSSTTNQTVCSNQLPYSWNGNSYAVAGTYNINLTSTSGCDSIATLNLTISNVLTSTTNISICSNQLPYSWNGNSYTVAGTYNINLTSASGCDSIATLNLTVSNVLTSTTNISICSNQLPYSWNGNSYNVSGTYNINLTSTSGCDSIATLNLTIKNTSSSTTNQTVCSNQLPYSWNGNSYNVSGTYNINLTSASGCDSIATLNLTVSNVLTSTTNISICSNQLPYSWNGNSYTIAGTYSANLTSSSGCDSVATIVLKEEAAIHAFAGNDTIVVYGLPVQLQASGGKNYLWQPSAPLNNAFISNPLATLYNDTKFIVTVTGDGGCTANDTILIKVFSNEGYYVPSAFSPNDDGINDLFRPLPVGIISTDFFRVYNRYGELLYESQSPTTGWDGTYKGKKQSIGNYIWVLQGHGINGRIISMKGNVVLVR